MAEAELKIKVIKFPEWHGELGWEVMSWIPVLRRKAADYGHVTVSSFNGMQPLYADFADEFIAHEGKGRCLDYPKRYRHDGIYYRYGDPMKCLISCDVLIHYRGISRKSSINYRRFGELVKMISKEGLTCAFIGSDVDLRVPGFMDCRGMPMDKLLNLMAAAKVIIGVSSGIMHLGALCGTDLVVWGDRRTYFSETLEQRYKVTWNPFEVRVGWIDADDWQPDPRAVRDKIMLLFRKTKKDKPIRDLMRDII